MNKVYYLVGVLTLSSCALLTEPDISDSAVFLIAPSNGLKTTVSTHTLWWDYVTDAEKYNLLIVSPTWDSINTLIIDTNVSGNKFTITLAPGEYDWAVSAYNGSSSTDYTIYHISIDTASNLFNQQVVLITPADIFYTNKRNVFFQWYHLPLATEYVFDIKQDSWAGQKVIPTRISISDTINLLLNEGSYVWGVQAKNENSYTYLYSTRELTIDLTAPGKPVITLPIKNYDTLSGDNLKITWNQPLTSLSPMRDSVFISSDTLFSAGKIKEISVVATPELKLSEYATGKYFCKVKTFDAAGNIGPVSQVRTFYIE